MDHVEMFIVCHDLLSTSIDCRPYSEADYNNSGSDQYIPTSPDLEDKIRNRQMTNVLIDESRFEEKSVLFQKKKRILRKIEIERKKEQNETTERK